MEKYVRFFEPQGNYRLSETLYSVQKDVDYIYENAFKQFIDDIKNKTYKDRSTYEMSFDGTFVFLFSSNLKTPLCVKAHGINPITIFCGSFKDGSFYSFREARMQISINRESIDTFYKNKDKLLNPKIKNSAIERMILNDLNITKTKASIAHELAHWIDESNYSVIAKIIGDEKDQEVIKKLMTLGYKDVDMTYFEIQAQIHGIKQLKNRHKKYWNTYSLEKVFELYPALFHVASKLITEYNEDTLRIWVHFLYKRMNREHLLGNNMKLPFQITKLFAEDYTRV